MVVLSLFAFLSGIVTILSPCILPVLPLVLSGSVGGKGRPPGVVLGFIVSFSTFTLILSALVQALNIAPSALRWAAVIIIIGFGLVLLVPPLQRAFEALASRLVATRQRQGGNGFGGGVVLGASLGMIWTPCVGPIMASVISLAVSSRVDGGSVLLVLSYSAGTAIPMLAVMLGGRKLLEKAPRLKAATGTIQRVFGAIMILIGVAIGFDLDRQFQTLVLRAFPGYGAGLTAIETIEPVQSALAQRGEALSGEPRELSWSDPPRSGRLADYGPAPALETMGVWINSEPLTMESLRGRVVLIDFWTYSCINCIRTLPHTRAWYEEYRDQGLVVIGVHSPEFPFERNEGNLKKAVEDLDVPWPVMQDNDFRMWRAYNNRYWPAHYFIDAEGRIRYYHFGEGEYETSERVIRTLLKEAGANPSAGNASLPEARNEASTPETYLGYGRSRGFLSEAVPEELQTYRLPRTPDAGEWGLEGDWVIRRSFIENRGSGRLALGFEAKDVYLVIEPLEEESRVRVLVDGAPGRNTQDAVDSQIRLEGDRMYAVTELEESGWHLLELEVEGRVRFYAFTFG